MTRITESSRWEKNSDYLNSPDKCKGSNTACAKKGSSLFCMCFGDTTFCLHYPLVSYSALLTPFKLFDVQGLEFKLLKEIDFKEKRN